MSELSAAAVNGELTTGGSSSSSSNGLSSVLEFSAASASLALPGEEELAEAPLKRRRADAGAAEVGDAVELRQRQHDGSAQPPLPERGAHRHHRRHERRKRRRRELQPDVDYAPAAEAEVEEDDDSTLLLDELRRVEGEEEAELLQLQEEADMDIEQLRESLRRQQEEEEEEGGRAAAEGGSGSSGSGSDSGYSSGEDDALDINDLPRLKDLQELRERAVAAGLPAPASLLPDALRNEPFPPRAAQQTQPLPSADSGLTAAVAASDSDPPAGAEAAGLKVEDSEAASAQGAGLRAMLTVETVEAPALSAALPAASEPVLLVLTAAAARPPSRNAAGASGEVERAGRQQRDSSGNSRSSASSSSSSSASSGSDDDGADSDSGSEADAAAGEYDAASAAAFFSSSSFHRSLLFPRKSSRVGPAFQVSALPQLLEDEEERRLEAQRTESLEGVKQEAAAEVREPQPDSVWWLRLETRRKEAEDREARGEAAEQRRELAGKEEREEQQQEAALSAVPAAVAVTAAAAAFEPAVRSQRSSAKRAREYIASVACSESSAAATDSSSAAALPTRPPQSRHSRCCSSRRTASQPSI